MSKYRDFQTIVLSKLALLVALAREKLILLFRKKSEGRIKQVGQENRQSIKNKTGGS